MAVNNYGYGLGPQIKVFAGGKERNNVTLPALSSAAIYLGGFVPGITNTAAAPYGIEFGVPAFSDDALIYGFVVGMHRLGSMVPLWDDPLKAGTVTDATGYLPVKYTFSSANDDASTTSAKYEMLDIMPIVPGDILEVTLWGGSTVPVVRATTTAYGTTASTANMGVGMSVDTTYHFALTESTGAKALANLDFVTTLIDGKRPANPYRVYVQCVRKSETATAVEA